MYSLLVSARVQKLISSYSYLETTFDCKFKTFVAKPYTIFFVLFTLFNKYFNE